MTLMSRRGWIGAGAALLLVGALALLVLFRSPKEGPSVRFVVPKGASARDIARSLKEQGLIRHRWTFLVWGKLPGQRGAPRPGVYVFSPSDSARSIFQKLRQGPPLVKVTFPEGWTSRQMGELLEEKGVVVSSAAFAAHVDGGQLEGFLFPDTYFFDQGLEPPVVTARLVRRFHEMEPKDMLAQAKVLKLSYKQIVTLASLVEKEARVPDERPLIAGVYMNRLRKRMLLEADPTVQYALGGWKARVTYEDLKVDSPYNTYRYRGLPPGPICNPGAASLHAAAHPLKTDFLFFVADQTGRHRFTKTYAEHLAAQREIRRERKAAGN